MEYLGRAFGEWKVASVHAVGSPFEWAWLVKVRTPEVQARMPIACLGDL
jgi:hypothetical protein